MKITFDIPNVQGCEVTSCAYNAKQSCHARAITIGEGIHAACDTFFVSDRHARTNSTTAGVGACKVTGCRYNSDFECSAETIRVGLHDTHADCLTFVSR
jgi:hypothetical protein